MATVTFSGPCKWARLQNADPKYNKYNISVGLDAKQLKELQALKVRNGFKLDDNGLFYVSFNRKESDGKPDVVDADGNPVTDLIGNGSEVTVKADVYTWTRDGATQAGIKLVAVRVDKLVKYEPKGEGAVAQPSRDVHAGSPSPSAPTNKPRIPF